jgi:hypothetical protein
MGTKFASVLATQLRAKVSVGLAIPHHLGERRIRRGRICEPVAVRVEAVPTEAGTAGLEAVRRVVAKPSAAPSALEYRVLAIGGQKEGLYIVVAIREIDFRVCTATFGRCIDSYVHCYPSTVARSKWSYHF